MFSDMKPAEKRLLEACKKGELLNLGDNRPFQKTDDNEIRGEFLRHLILSNNQEIEENSKKYILKIDPKGVQFTGAYISGIFNFSFCSTDLPFLFANSVFENEMILIESKIKLLFLDGSKINLISATRLVCNTTIFLRNGFEALGEIDFSSAYIGGSLDCTNGKFENKNGMALNCHGTKIQNGVFLKNNFKALGEVDFASAYIGGNLECGAGIIENKNGVTLNCDSVRIGRNVFFMDNFRVNGQINFAISKIGRGLAFSELEIDGNLNLISLEVNTILIHKLSISKNIYLDGLIYEHLNVKNLNYKTLVSLLNKMPKEEAFKPQPYKQMAKVLRNMGHQKEANDIMIKYNDIITSRSENWFIKKLKQIYGTTAGYGYKPMKVIKWMTIVWFLCSLFYWNASKVAVFAPTNPLVFQKKDFYDCNINSNGTPWSDFFNYCKYSSTNNWVLNENLDGEYTTFNPFMYSLDVILPIVDLQVEKDWGQYVSMKDWTLNDFIRWLMWFEILFGWIYSLILVAILSGLAKNEKD